MGSTRTRRLTRFVAAEVAAEQMADLVARGVEAFHIYTLNRAELSEAVCTVLGVAAPEDGHCSLRRLRRRRFRSMPKTIAPRKTKAAPTTTKFNGLMKLIGWPPSASRDAY